MKARFEGLVSQVQDALHQTSSFSSFPRVPRQLDLSFVTNRIMVMSSCRRSANPTYNDSGRDIFARGGSDKGPKTQNQNSSHSSYARKRRRNDGNSPVILQEFLEGKNAIILNVSDEIPDDRTLKILKRQWIQWEWRTLIKSETPELSVLLDLCYSISAYLSLSPSHSVVIMCQNGKTRSAIALACYLRYAGIAGSTVDGFATFLRNRCPQLDSSEASSHIPPSLQQLFSNFDSLFESQDYANTKPLLLRAIALQGVPVEDKPCIDIYSNQQLVYSSRHSEKQALWADEEGFYKVNLEIHGDFLIVCRFGGPYSMDISDPSKVLWRYCNSTGFLSVGNHELPKQKVDISRRYDNAMEEEDFLLSLILESYWDVDNPSTLPSTKSLAPFLAEHLALERGWQSLTRLYRVQPNQEDIDNILSFQELVKCPRHIARVALQLTNLDFLKARDLLLEKYLIDWWVEREGEGEGEGEGEPFLTGEAERGRIDIRKQYQREVATCGDILLILQNDDSETDSTDNAKSQPQHVLEDFDEPFVYPNRGDVVDGAPRVTEGMHTTTEARFPPVEPERPRIPYQDTKRRQSSMGMSSSDFQVEKVLPLYTEISHTDVLLTDLIEMEQKSWIWTQKFIETEIEEADPGAATNYGIEGEDEIKAHQDVQGADIVGKKEREQPVDGNGGDDAGPDEDVEGWEVADGNDGHDKNAKVLGFVPAKTNEVALKDDPDYEKYFRMLKMGLPMDAVKHSMKRDGKDPSVMDLDHNRSVKEQRVQSSGSDGHNDVPLNQDPEYEKYFRMLKMGLPMDAVKHSMKRDGKDPGIMDLDASKSLESQAVASDPGDGPPLNQDPEYEKYFKMLKMGLPADAVKHSLKRDGKDPSILDLDPNRSLKSQQNITNEGPPLNQDPEFEKYFKMLKMGLPVGAVKNALQRDGKDPRIMDLDPNRSLQSQKRVDVEDTGPPLKDDPEYQKYFKMLKMGLPIGAVKNALQRDGKDPSIMDLNPEKSLKSQSGNSGEEEMKDTGIPLKDDPEYSKYFKMLKMGLPVGAVKNALQRDEKDPSIMDLDPEHSVAFQLAKKSGGSAFGSRSARKKPKKRVRRKKIYWTPIDPSKVVEGSLWSMVKGKVEMEQLDYDQREFDTLFTESTNPADKKSKATNSGGEKKKKENVQLIDGKRSMNGGIILARLKMKYSKIADMVNIMDSGPFDSTQLKALKEFLPTDEERGSLEGHMRGTEGSLQLQQEALSTLPECEKYMIAMLLVKNAHSKFDAMLFKVQFNSRLADLVKDINIVKQASEEVKSSEKLRKLMATILTLVNQINTGGDGNLALGFSLDALLKLNEAKAFDKKTSVLQYLVKLVRQNDEELLKFGRDIVTVPDAEGVVLETLAGDVKTLSGQLDDVAKTAKNEADILEKDGKLPPPDMTEEKKDDSEQSEHTLEDEKQNSGHNDEDPNLKVRTPMEVFTKKARQDVDDALDLLKQVSSTYSSVLKYFGEDEKMPSNEFFGTLQTFVVEFKKAEDHVEKVERQRLKEKLKKATKKVVASKLLGELAKSPKGKPDMGAIASLAVAKVKRMKTSDAEDSTAAVLDSSPSEDDSRSAKNKVESAGSPDNMSIMSGIAAMAAAAAAKKNEVANGKSDNSSTMGGIAAMAAAAAAKKKKKVESGGLSDNSSTMGGIAAMAAAAAAKKEKAESIKSDNASTMGGIAAMAAAAAEKKKKEHIETVRSSKNFSAVGDVAAAAAAAAKKGKVESAKSRGNELTMGGIAPMAAAAKKDKVENSISSGNVSTTDGIADMAVAPVVARRDKVETTGSSSSMSTVANSTGKKDNAERARSSSDLSRSDTFSEMGTAPQERSIDPGGASVAISGEETGRDEPGRPLGGFPATIDVTGARVSDGFGSWDQESKLESANKEECVSVTRESTEAAGLGSIHETAPNEGDSDDASIQGNLRAILDEGYSLISNKGTEGDLDMKQDAKSDGDTLEESHSESIGKNLRAILDEGYSLLSDDSKQNAETSISSGAHDFKTAIGEKMNSKESEQLNGFQKWMKGWGKEESQKGNRTEVGQAKDKRDVDSTVNPQNLDVEFPPEQNGLQKFFSHLGRQKSLSDSTRSVHNERPSPVDTSRDNEKPETEEDDNPFFQFVKGFPFSPQNRK